MQLIGEKIACAFAELDVYLGSTRIYLDCLAKPY